MRERWPRARLLSVDSSPEMLERAQYLEAYTRAILASYPPRSDGKRLFSFPRLFIVALRK